jgi:glycosyltransferase involved in cell wall biosynthesis
MFWPPNVEGVLWFAWNVWPRVVEQVPEARLAVVGKDPPREVRDLPRHVRNVVVTGYVPDPAPYLAETAVFIVPLRAGGGMRVKIVDAWCWGVPIVSTSIGAEGIELEDGRNILIADEPQALADAVVRVLRDPPLGRRLRENGRRWVEQRYDWRQVYARWDRVYGALK